MNIAATVTPLLADLVGTSTIRVRGSAVSNRGM